MRNQNLSTKLSRCRIRLFFSKIKKGNYNIIRLRVCQSVPRAGCVLFFTFILLLCDVEYVYMRDSHIVM